MLTCDDVRAELPLLATGEPVEGDVRDHLASCEACRAEERALRAALDHVRGDLAALDPSPFLEDRVAEIARAPVGRAQAPRPWLTAAIAVAAAALLAAVLLVPRWTGPAGEGKDATDDPGGASLVELPPTAGRAWPPQRAVASPGEMNPTTYQLAGVPPPDVALLGWGLMERMPAEGGGTLTEHLQRLRAKLRDASGAPYVTIEVSAPGGATARVRALVREDFKGTLLLEEPLARALGLHEHVVPDKYAAILGDTSTSARFVVARVRVPAAAYAETLEVMARMPGDPQPADPVPMGGIPPKPRIEIHGARPDLGWLGTNLRMEGGTLQMDDWTIVDLQFDRSKPAWLPLETLRPRAGSVQFRAGEWPACTVVLPAVDFGAGGPLAWAVELERLTVTESSFTAGAAVTGSRVWRGRTAIPSRESVFSTMVRSDGHLSIVRVRGEAGPLRLREVKPDGTVAWHEITVDTGRTARVRISESGTITVGPRTFAPLKLGSSERPFDPDPGTLAALRDLLAQRANAAGRDADGCSRLGVTIEAHAQAPFVVVSWVIGLCAHPRVMAPSLHFSVAGAAHAGLGYRLPMDRALGAPAPERGEGRLRLDLRESGLVWTGLHLSRNGFRLVSPQDWEMLEGAVRSFGAQAKTGRASVVLEVQPGVHFADVLRVLGQLRQVADVVFPSER